MYYKPALWSQLQLFDQLYPLDTVKNRRIYTRIFQCLLRMVEWYVTVRDKYCANSMLKASETGEITCMFLPHNKDPDRFVVPPTWRRADVESSIPTAMPSAADIRRSMGADEEKAKQLYNEFADCAAQRLSEYDRRDRERLDTICASVEEIMASMRMKRVEQNEYVYISVRAPQHFKSCTMFNEAEKRARIKELLYDNTSYKERLKELRRENQKDMPERKGYVAEAVRNI